MLQINNVSNVSNKYVMFQKNMHAIMGSEQTVAELMNVIDAALEQVELIETQLDHMDQMLGVSIMGVLLIIFTYKSWLPYKTMGIIG